MEPLSSRNSSELLTDTLELCPPTQQNNVFFVVLFLQRLPREIRVLLTHEDHTDLRQLASGRPCRPPGHFRLQTTAWTGCHHRQGHEESTLSTIVAIKGKSTAQPQKNKNQKQQHSRQLPPRPQGSQSNTVTPSPSNLVLVFWPVFLPLGPRRKCPLLQSPLHVAGKLAIWGVVGAIYPSSPPKAIENLPAPPTWWTPAPPSVLSFILQPSLQVDLSLSRPMARGPLVGAGGG